MSTEVAEVSVKVSPLAVVKDRTQSSGKRLDALVSVIDYNGLLGGLPRHITPERMKRTFMMAIRANPALLDCTPESILSSVQEAATLGLEVDGVLGHAYLVPFKDECTLIAGYRGLLDMARRVDNIELKTRCVYKGDEFDYCEGDDDRIIHKPNQDPTAEFREEDITHVYLVAKRHGEVICRSVWTRAQIESHKKKYSKAWKRSDSAWQTAWSTMARKTLIRDAINRGEIPVSSEVQKMASREEFIEAEYVKVDTSAPLIDLRRGDASDALVSAMQGSVGQAAKDQVEPRGNAETEKTAERPKPDTKDWARFGAVKGDNPERYITRLNKAADKAPTLEAVDDIATALNQAVQDGHVSPEETENVWITIERRHAEFGGENRETL